MAMNPDAKAREIGRKRAPLHKRGRGARRCEREGSGSGVDPINEGERGSECRRRCEGSRSSGVESVDAHKRGHHTGPGQGNRWHRVCKRG